MLAGAIAITTTTTPGPSGSAGSRHEVLELRLVDVHEPHRGLLVLHHHRVPASGVGCEDGHEPALRGIGRHEWILLWRELLHSEPQRDGRTLPCQANKKENPKVATEKWLGRPHLVPALPRRVRPPQRSLPPRPLDLEHELARRQRASVRVARRGRRLERRRSYSSRTPLGVFALFPSAVAVGRLGSPR